VPAPRPPPRRSAGGSSRQSRGRKGRGGSRAGATATAASRRGRQQHRRPHRQGRPVAGEGGGAVPAPPAPLCRAVGGGSREGTGGGAREGRGGKGRGERRVGTSAAATWPRKRRLEGRQGQLGRQDAGAGEGAVPAAPPLARGGAAGGGGGKMQLARAGEAARRTGVTPPACPTSVRAAAAPAATASAAAYSREVRGERGWGRPRGSGASSRLIEAVGPLEPARTVYSGDFHRPTTVTVKDSDYLRRIAAADPPSRCDWRCYPRGG